jgi:hypothetical protein
MTHDVPESDEVFRLLAELVDGGLTPQQAERLRGLLRGNPDAQDLYLRYMSVHAQLHLDYASGATPVAMPGGSAMPIRPLSTTEFEPIGSQEFPVSLGGPDRAIARALIRPRSLALVSGLAAALVAIGMAVVSWRNGPRGGRTVDRPPLKVDVADGLAVVVRTEGVSWETADGRRPKAGEVLPPGRLRVDSGRATFSMLSGVAVVVEGPAEVELISVDRVSCLRGKLRARVPDGAEGFLVSGPGSAVVDQGTEFGVNIRPDGKSRGKVFEGEVEAAVLGTSGALRRSRLVREDSDPFEIDPGTGTIGSLTGPEDFARPFQPAAPTLTPDPSYPAAVLRSRPWCYWRFESVAGGEVPDEVPGRPPLLVAGPVHLARTSPDNHCAVFAAGETGQYLELKGLWKPERTPGYAIELWFLSEVIGHAALASMVAPQDTMHHLSLVELTSSNRRALFRPASVRFLFRWPTGRNGGDNLFSNDIYVPYRWHHLVAQVNGGRMELFLDGALQATQTLDPGDSTAPCQFLLGRLTTLPESSPLHHTGYRRSFAGLMDEVALYNRPLTAEEVRSHCRLATQAEGQTD